MPSPLAVSTALFDGYPMELALAEIAGAGVAFAEPAFIAGYVDFDETSFSPAAAKHLAAAMAAAGLSAIAVSAHHDMGGEDAAASTIRRLRFAEELGARFLITNATTADRRDEWLRNLDLVLPVCAEAGIVIALENPGHGSASLIPDGAAGAALIRSLGSGHLRLNYDFGNTFTYGGERVRPEEDLDAALAEAVHGHLKDVRSDKSGWAFVPLGEGAIDYRRILRRLAERAAAMPLALELPLRLQRPMRQSPIRLPAPLPLSVLREALARSLAFIRENDAPGGQLV